MDGPAASAPALTAAAYDVSLGGYVGAVTVPPSLATFREELSRFLDGQHRYGGRVGVAAFLVSLEDNASFGLFRGLDREMQAAVMYGIGKLGEQAAAELHRQAMTRGDA